jgi:FAD/FMN-containing dehydrogenase
VTVGGAIANDVHGKNHHGSGTFGNHVLRFELLRSDGVRRICSADQNPELFAATIGGLGLTGVITWAEFRLIRVPGPWIDQEVIRYRGLSEFLDLSAQAESRFDYTVAWIDCLAGGRNLGRGHLIQGNHSSFQGEGPRLEKFSRPSLSVPFQLPVSPLFGASVRAFNELYFRRQFKRTKIAKVHFNPFFYPLDSIDQWNRIYGRQGFLQYQFVVPQSADGLKALEQILRHTSDRGMGSFLAVMKIFGKTASPGLLSFPRPGITLALDFKATTSGLLPALSRFDEWVMEAGGAVYPAKDARMKPEVFRASFPALARFRSSVDPAISSSFWRRMEQ